jgi:hypothetical protein
MEKISININELVKIMSDLEKSLNALNTLKSPNGLDLLLNGIEASLLDEDWQYIHNIEVPVTESFKRIKRLIQLAEIESGINDALKKFERDELVEYIEDKKLGVKVTRKKTNEIMRKEISKALIGDLSIERQ